MSRDDRGFKALLDRVDAADVAMNEIISLMEVNTRTNIIPLYELLAITEKYSKSILESDERFMG